MREYKYLGQNSGLGCGDFYTNLKAFYRRRELRRLVPWVLRKNLKNPLKLCQTRLEDEEKRLFHYALTTPRLYRAAYRLVQFSTIISHLPPIFAWIWTIYKTKLLTDTAIKSYPIVQ